jgi:hypothetical protein
MKHMDQNAQMFQALTSSCIFHLYFSPLTIGMVNTSVSCLGGPGFEFA